MSSAISQWPSVEDLAAKVAAGELKAVDQVEKALKVIKEKSEFNAVIAVIEDRAQQRAREIDDKVAKGEKAGKLAGVPFIAKDNFLTFGSETTAASNILKGFKAPYQATAIEKLEAEGAICVAKANLDAFGHGVSTENSDFQTTKNPHDQEYVPGGSSGGSAASTALGMVPFALGTDTGGSNRLPASFCGVVGYKPTYGLVSRSGVVAMASSTDTVGPIAKRVEDVAYVLDILAGRDDLDSTTIERSKAGYQALEMDLNGKTVGVIKEYMDEGVEPGVKAKVQAVIDQLEKAGAKVTTVSIPALSQALACYYILCPAEISSNLGRYDGQHYGLNFSGASDLQESYEATREQGFGNEAKRRIMIGTYVLSSGYYDAYYKKAQQLRTKLIQEFEKVFKQVDFLAGPVAPSTAFKIGQKADEPLKMYLMDIMTVAANLVGVPAISIPAGKSGNMPVGLQLIAPQRKDRELLQMAQATEGLIAV